MDNQNSPAIHGLSAMVTLALDWVWTIPEAAATASVVGIPLMVVLIAVLFSANFTAVSLVQRHVAKDSWGAAVAKGMVMGIIAAVPYPFVGTSAGGVLLAWAGVKAISNRNSGQAQLPPPR